MKTIKLIILSSLCFIITAIFTTNIAFASFSESDFQGTWYGHALESNSGSDGSWVYFTATIDNQGNFTVQTHMPDSSTGTESGKFNITSDGIITIDGESTPHGAMSIDKNTFVFTDTWDTGDYAMLVFVKGGGSFSQSDLTGTWYGHTLTSGSEEVWEYMTLTVDGQGNVSVQTTDIDGNTESENNVALRTILIFFDN